MCTWLAVRYFCPCREFEWREEPLTLRDAACLHLLEELYFCEDCAAVRCHMCIDKEPASRFCPVCLFEVTQTAARESHNRCMRNCLQCPECNANVIAHVQEGDGDYHLKCALCAWELDGFHKKKALALQIWELQDRHSQVTTVRNAFREGADTHLDWPTETKINGVKLPLPVPLRAKFTKLCRACRGLLVKPDPQPGTAKLKHKTMAIDTFPHIRACVRSGWPEKIFLTFVNPLSISVRVGVAADKVAGTSSVTLLTPSVLLGPASAKLDDVSLLKQVPEFQVLRETDASRRVFMEGVRNKREYELGPNWACIELAVVNNHTGNIPLLCTFRFEAAEDTFELTSWVSIGAQSSSSG